MSCDADVLFAYSNIYSDMVPDSTIEVGHVSRFISSTRNRLNIVGQSRYGARSFVIPCDTHMLAYESNTCQDMVEDLDGIVTHVKNTQIQHTDSGCYTRQPKLDTLEAYRRGSSLMSLAL